VLKGGFMDGQVLSADDANRLADLESREVMLSKIAGLLKGEMSRAASTFVSVPSAFLSLLEAFKERLPDEAAPGEEAAPEGPAAEAPVPAQAGIGDVAGPISEETAEEQSGVSNEGDEAEVPAGEAPGDEEKG
jgi:hypothetical protein